MLAQSNQKSEYISVYY